jgi:hypothetical protein
MNINITGDRGKTDSCFGRKAQKLSECLSLISIMIKFKCSTCLLNFIFNRVLTNKLLTLLLLLLSLLLLLYN